MNYSYQLVSKKNNISYTYYIKIPEYIAKNQLGLVNVEVLVSHVLQRKPKEVLKWGLNPIKKPGNQQLRAKSRKDENNYHITWECLNMNHSNYHGRPPTKYTRKPGQCICSHFLALVNESASLSFCIPEVDFFARLPVWVLLNIYPSSEGSVGRSYREFVDYKIKNIIKNRLAFLSRYRVQL